MAIEDFVKNHSKEIIWGTHIAVAAWAWWEGMIFGKDIPSWVVVLVLGASLYVYDKLHKALLAEQSKEPKKIYIKEKKNEPSGIDGLDKPL